MAVVSPTMVVAAPSAPTIMMVVAALDLDARRLGGTENIGRCRWHRGRTSTHFPWNVSHDSTS
jgi:hypothetical protein